MPAQLQICDAKGGKDRQVPLSGPLRERLTGYRPHVAGAARLGLVLPRQHGRPADLPLMLGNIYKNFRRFLWQARVSDGGPGRRPRMHHLRHWVDSNLRSWFDIGALLPVLQAYMDHSSISYTAGYLKLTAES